MKFRSLAVRLFGMLALSSPVAAETPRTADGPVLELRQYKIIKDRRDAFIGFFESHFVETQEALGMRLVGQFRDTDDPTRFTWLRAFPSMAARAPALQHFYFGPVWQTNRTVANGMLDDNDDVLLLRPAWSGAGFAQPVGTRPAPGAPETDKGMIVATIEYLWKMPDEGYAAYFRDRLAPTYRAAGLPILAVYSPETIPNDFPRLPVRQSERVLVWFTRVANRAAYTAAMKRVEGGAEWRSELHAKVADSRERQPQVLFLSPTPRSLLR